MSDDQRNTDQALVHMAAGMGSSVTRRTRWIPPTSADGSDAVNLNPEPQRTRYREAILRPPFEGDFHYPEEELIRWLAEKDRIFMRRLDEDKAFQDMFWHYSNLKWETHTEEEESGGIGAPRFQHGCDGSS